MTSDAADLAGLIGRVALRDRGAFQELYRLAAPKLFAICLRILKDKSEAEDALQEVFVKLWHSADRFRAGEQSSPAAWMNAIARNQAIDVLRTRRPGGGDLDAAELVPDTNPGPEAQAVIRSEGRRLDACISEMNPERAEAVRRAYVEGDSYVELSDRFKVPLNTMRSWLRRGLLQLRECLSR